jgi:hypothetical protein
MQDKVEHTLYCRHSEGCLEHEQTLPETLLLFAAELATGAKSRLFTLFRPLVTFHSHLAQFLLFLLSTNTIRKGSSRRSCTYV